MIIGLTGGIGSGKSTVCQLFTELGAEVIDADRLAREITNSDQQILDTIREVFGENNFHPDGRLNRAQLGRLVFGNKTALEKLNQIIHPAVIRTIQEKITQFRVEKPKKILIVESAILFESHMENLFDLIIVVDADISTVIKRLKNRDHLTDQDIKKRLKSQMPANEKKARAHFTIQNNGDLPMLKTHVEEILRKIKSYKIK